MLSRAAEAAHTSLGAAISKTIPLQAVVFLGVLGELT